MSLFSLLGQNYGLNFKDVIAAETGATFDPEELITLIKNDLERSLPYLGKDPLTDDQANAVWRALTNVSELCINN